MHEYSFKHDRSQTQLFSYLFVIVVGVLYIPIFHDKHPAHYILIVLLSTFFSVFMLAILFKKYRENRFKKFVISSDGIKLGDRNSKVILWSQIFRIEIFDHNITALNCVKVVKFSIKGLMPINVILTDFGINEENIVELTAVLIKYAKSYEIEINSL